MEYGIYATREEAEKVARGDAVMQVTGGYQVMDWSDFNRRSYDEAMELFCGGWRYTDRDELMEHYSIDEDHAALITDRLYDIEMEDDEFKDQFIHDLFDWSDCEKMTVEEAKETIESFRKDGEKVPVTLTPEELSTTWNALVDSVRR